MCVCVCLMGEKVQCYWFKLVHYLRGRGLQCSNSPHLNASHVLFAGEHTVQVDYYTVYTGRLVTCLQPAGHCHL